MWPNPQEPADLVTFTEKTVECVTVECVIVTAVCCVLFYLSNLLSLLM